MNRIKSLTFVLENCEAIEVDGKYVGSFDVSGINKQISRVAVNAVIAQDICDSFFVELHPDGNKEYDPFGLDDDLEKRSCVFDRLCAWNDITQIEFDLCTDEVYYGTEEPNSTNCIHYHFYVSWHPDPCNDTINLNQHTYVSKQGWLYISVNGDSDLDTMLNKVDIDSQNYVTATEVLCDLGDEHYEKARKSFVESAKIGDEQK